MLILGETAHIFNIYHCAKVYLVTGGYTGFSSLSSTEVLLQGAAQWMEVGALPVATQGLRAVSFNNKILVAGEIMLELQGKYIVLCCRRLG